MKFNRPIFLLFFLLSGPFIQMLRAQEEGGKRQTIDITSTFKPVLRNAAKINFNASPPVPDNNKPGLTYNIPAQNIYPSFQSVPLKPLAYTADSLPQWENSNQIKVGYGNLSTPFVQAGFTMGTDKSKLVILADHISSKGKIQYQDYSKTGIHLFGATPLAENLELQGKFEFNQDKYHLYGYDHSLYNYSKSELQQRFQTFTAEAGIRNLAPTSFSLNYHPDLRISLFSDNRKNNESNAVLDLPVERVVGDRLGIQLGFNADFTRLSPDQGSAINNNLFTVPFAVNFKTPNFKIHAGMIPSWSNSDFKMLPDIILEFPISPNKWVIQAGWISYYEKGNYQRFASINPYLALPAELRNTRMLERYVGFKGTIADHFSYDAKLGYVEFNEVPLFINDNLDGKTFLITYEEQLKAVQVRGELGYSQGEDFSITGSVNWYKFNEQKTESNPWGLIPSEIKAAMRWKIIKDLWLTSDFYLWDGPLYKTSSGGSERLGAAGDLNAGLEFRITQRLRAWTQFNNIFNARYQRWHQYDAYGFNMLAGITFFFK